MKKQLFQHDFAIYNADPNELENLKKDNLEQVMCRIIPEVTKQKVWVHIPGKTLYQLV